MKPLEGFAIEKRDRDDVSISIGKVRLRFQQWTFWILVLIVIGFFAMQIASIKWTGKPVPIKGVIERGHYRGTNTTAAVRQPK